MNINKIYDYLINAKSKLSEQKIDDNDLENLNKKVCALGYIKSAISEIEKEVSK